MRHIAAHDYLAMEKSTLEWMVVSYASRRPEGMVVTGNVALTYLSERHMRDYLGFGMNNAGLPYESFPMGRA